MLMLALLLATAPAMAAELEPVLARILAIEPEQVTVTVPNADAATAPTVLKIRLEATTLAPELAPGSLVRLWPSAAGTTAGARLMPLERGMATDRTGVRARLQRGVPRPPGGRRVGR
ncbi:hypothetical protein CKO12_04400 [Chromatium okenii]|nr:hypothetical protein [Chromatium okenii]